MTLREDLHRVADGAPLEPIAMAGVRAKARVIRRRRITTAVGGAAVGVAAIAAAAVLVLPGSGDHTQPLPATRTPSPTSSVSPTTSASVPSGNVITVDLANPPAESTTGASITVPNWMSGMLTDATGASIAVASPVYGAVRDPSTGDWFGMTFAQGEWTWNQWTASGSQVGSTPAPSSRVAITPDGRTWAVMVDNGGSPEIQLFHAGQQSPTVIPLTLPQGEPANGAGVDGILPNGDVVFEGDVGDIRIAHTDGSLTKLPGGWASAQAVSATGLIAVQVPGGQASNGGACYALVHEDGTGVQGSLCGGDSAGFGPDGNTWVRAGAEPVGGRTDVSFRDVSHHPSGPKAFAAFSFPAGAVVDTGDAAWIGDAYVVPVWSSRSWRLVWLARDGYKVTRSLITPGSSAQSPYLLGAGPLAGTNP